MLQGQIPKIIILVLLALLFSFFGYQLARYYATTPELTFAQRITNLLLLVTPNDLPINVKLQYANSRAAVSLLYKCTSEAGDKIIYLVRQWAGNLDGGGDHRNSYFSESGDLIESFYVPPYSKVAPAQMPLKDCRLIKRRVPLGLDYGPSDWFTQIQKN